MTATTASPKQKKKGPIRWEAILPFTIIVALIWAYFFLFFDSHLRKALEYVGTQVNGAEVNLGSLRTSFWNASLEIRKLELTDASEPTKNQLQIGEIRWRMLWDALLRGKIAIHEASVLGIAIGTPRARPGYVIPPPPPNTEPGALETLKEQALQKAQAEFSRNVLGDLAAILGGMDPTSQLKSIENELKASAQVKALQEELAQKEKNWKERLAKLPQQKDIQEIESRLKTVKLDRFNNPQEVQQSLQQIDGIFKDIDNKIKEVDAAKQALGSDIGTYQNTLKELEQVVQQDIKDLESRLKLPKLDMQSLSRSIFGPMFLGRVKEVNGYIEKARQYAPPKKSAEEKAAFKPTPRERANGRNYAFGRPNSYPLFWLKEAKISSKTTPEADWSGDLEGALRDVTNDPPTLGRPTLISFKGDFPKQAVMGVDGLITIDHVTETPVETAQIKIASFPLSNRTFIDSPEVKLGMDSSVGSTAFDVELKGDGLKISNMSTFQNAPSTAGFLTSEAKEPILADILKKSLTDVKRVTLNASVGGTWSAPGFDIDSSLGRDLATAFDKQIQAKLNEARAKLQNFINEKIGKEKERLLADFNKAKAQVDNLIKEKQAEIDKVKNSVEKAKNDAINNQKKSLEQEGKKAVDDLKKKFGF